MLHYCCSNCRIPFTAIEVFFKNLLNRARSGEKQRKALGLPFPGQCVRLLCTPTSRTNPRFHHCDPLRQTQKLSPEVESLAFYLIPVF